MSLAGLIEAIGRRVLVTDGATGTALQALGLPAGVSPELWNVEQPDLVRRVYREYVAAGAELVTANTFGGSRLKLDVFGLGDRVRELNAAGIARAREAAGDQALVAASLGPTGHLLEPYGDLPFERAVEVFAEQVRAFEEAGADLVAIETMGHVAELKAAMIAVREASRLPFLASMAFGHDGQLSMAGSDGLALLATALPFGPLAIGANCGRTVGDMVEVVRQIARFSPLPILARPNAGLPRLVQGRTMFELGPEEYLAGHERLLEAGAAIIGGCCGTTATHIEQLAARLRGRPVRPPVKPSGVLLAGTRGLAAAGPGRPFLAIGERINPTGRTALRAELAAGSLEGVRRDALAQFQAGARVLDVNMGVPGADEADLMRRAVHAVQNVVPAALAIDSADPAAVAAGLAAAQGRPLVNSVSGETARLAAVLPVAARFGAAVIALCMDDGGIPVDATARIRIARRILERAVAAGLGPNDILVDCLTLTAGSQPEQVGETLRAVAEVADDLGLATVLGISNVSFGLPARSLVTAAFLSMAIQKGLSAGIVNVLDGRIRDAYQAADVLAGRDPGARRYIRYCARQAEAAGSADEVPAAPADAGGRLKLAVIQGDRDAAARLAAELAAAGLPAPAIIDRMLVPALDEVGRRYESGSYFLPQLIASGDAMQQAFEALHSALAHSPRRSLGRLVIATVKGDIHDIGKNIVALILRNSGFEVEDLGKDVAADRILEAARRPGTVIVAASALMTTTLPEMAHLVARVRSELPVVKTMVGGAVVTAAYAASIGAHGFAGDAVAAGRVALGLIQAAELEPEVTEC